MSGLAAPTTICYAPIFRFRSAKTVTVGGINSRRLLSYQLDNAISLGVGARYWHMQSKGYAHFEDLGGTAQPLDFKADIYGVFLQGSYHFDAI